MTSIGEVAAQIRAAMQDAHDAEGAAAQAEQGLTTAAGALDAVVEGTGQDAPGQVIAALVHAASKLQDARSRIAASIEAVNGYVTGTLGAAGTATPDASTAPPPVPTPRPHLGAPPPPAYEPVGPAAPVPSFLHRASNRIPIRLEGKTSGMAFTRNGESLTNTVIVSGADRDPRRVDGLVSRDAQGRPWQQMAAVLHHVEGFVAGLMRDGGHRDVVLLLTTSRVPVVSGAIGTWVG